VSTVNSYRTSLDFYQLRRQLPRPASPIELWSGSVSTFVLLGKAESGMKQPWYELVSRFGLSAALNLPGHRRAAIRDWRPSDLLEKMAIPA